MGFIESVTNNPIQETDYLRSALSQRHFVQYVQAPLIQYLPVLYVHTNESPGIWPSSHCVVFSHLAQTFSERWRLLKKHTIKLHSEQSECIERAKWLTGASLHGPCEAAQLFICSFQSSGYLIWDQTDRGSGVWTANQGQRILFLPLWFEDLNSMQMANAEKRQIEPEKQKS